VLRARLPRAVVWAGPAALVRERPIGDRRARCGVGTKRKQRDRAAAWRPANQALCGLMMFAGLPARRTHLSKKKSVGLRCCRVVCVCGLMMFA
jgi:hypothetical protein